MVSIVYKMAHEMASGDLAQAIVYGNPGGYKNHVQICYDCAGLFHIRNKYCFNVAYLDRKEGGPNHASTISTIPEHESRRKHSAYEIAFYASNRVCYAGIVVVRDRYDF